MSDEERDWYIEEIISKSEKKAIYLVKWEEVEEPTWHTIEELYDYESRDVIADALEAMKEKERKKKREKEKSPAAKKSEAKEISAWDLAQQTRKETEKQVAQQLRHQRLVEQQQAEIEAAEKREKEREAFQVRDKERQRIRAYIEGLLIEFYKEPANAVEKRAQYEKDSLEAAKDSRRTLRVREPIACVRPVKSLWNICIAYICENLDLYDGFENVPVEWKAQMFGYMSRRNQLTSEKFAEIIDPNQKGLNLSNCQQSLTIDFFKALGKAPLLTRLVVHNSKNINDLVFSAIAKNCPSIQYLDLSGSCQLQSIEEWQAPQFAFLEVLKLAHCKELTVIDGPMKFMGYILGSTAVSEGGTKAKYQQIIADGYQRFISKISTLKNLKEVDISYSMTDSTIALAFLQNENLEILRAGSNFLKLSYSNNRVEEAGLLFPKASKLQVLDLARYLNLVGRESRLFTKILKLPKPDHPDRHLSHKKSEHPNHAASEDKGASATTLSTTTASSTAASKQPQQKRLLIGDVSDGDDEEQQAALELLTVPTLDDSEELDYDVAFPCLTALALPMLHANYIAWILKHYTTLTSLSLGDNEIMTATLHSDVLRTVMERDNIPLNNIQTLDVTGMSWSHRDIDDCLLAKTNWKKLKLIEPHNFNFAHMVKLWRLDMPEIEEIHAQGWGYEHSMNHDSSSFDLEKVPDPALLKVNFFPTLKRLTLNSMRWITNDLFRQLVSANVMPNLEFIDLRGMPLFQLDFQPVQYLVTEFKSLQTLFVGCTHKYQTSNRLQHLDCCFTPSLNEPIANGHNLKTLGITWSRQCNLQWSPPIKWEVVFSSLPNLKTLYIQFNSVSGGSSHTVTNNLIDSLPEAKNLKRLETYGVYFRTEELTTISKSKKLKNFSYNSPGTQCQIFSAWLAQQSQPLQCDVTVDTIKSILNLDEHHFRGD